MITYLLLKVRLGNLGATPPPSLRFCLFCPSCFANSALHAPLPPILFSRSDRLEFSTNSIASCPRMFFFLVVENYLAVVCRKSFICRCIAFSVITPGALSHAAGDFALPQLALAVVEEIFNRSSELYSQG